MVDDAKQSRWDRLQGRFKNSWIGIALLALAAATMFLTQIGESTKKASEWINSTSHAGLDIQTLPNRPLEKFSGLVVALGPNTIFPAGANLSADLRHDHKADETISIRSLDVSIDAYDPHGACPYKLSSDRIAGAGANPVKVFVVHLSEGHVDSVERIEQPHGPVRHGRSKNLLELDEPLSLTLKKADDVEPIVVRFVIDDPGRYKVGLSASYTGGSGVSVKAVGSVSMCLPKD